MRFLVLLVAVLSAGCVSSALRQTDDMAERRIRQLEDSFARQIASTQEAVSKVKTEAIDQAKVAAKDLVSQASEDLKKTGEALIDKAADRSDALVKNAIADATKTIDDQRTKATADLREVLKTDVPKAVGEAVVGAADKVAERLGVAKKTGTDENGNPMTWWVLGGGGLAGTLFTFGKTAYRMWTAKKREDEDDEWFAEKLAEKTKARKDGSHVVHPCSCGAPAPASPPQG